MKITRYLNLMILFTLAAPSMALAQGTPTKAPPEQAAVEAKRQGDVKGYILPIVAGIKSAKMSAAVLHELSTTEPFERADARKTAELAEQAVRIAHERAQELHDMKGLTAEARAQADSATKQLKEARASVERIQRQVGVVEGVFRRDEADNVRNESMRLNAQLADAERAIGRIADAYHVSTNLDLRATPPPSRQK